MKLLKSYSPTTPSRRHLIRLNNNELISSPLLKNKIKGKKNIAGKNNEGKIVSYHKGGGQKKNYRTVNFLRNIDSICIVTSLEYDPYRTSNIASVFDIYNKQFYYIIATKNIKVGDIVKSGLFANINNGHALTISKIPVGSLINNISPKKKKQSQISRAAGTFSQLVEKTSKFGRIKLSSGEHRIVSTECIATLGVVSNEFHFLTTKGKAGRSRWLNKRPKVRGVAMNPVDHPHGGGEGKTSGGKSSVTPWGKNTKGGRTSNSTNTFILIKKLKK